jgi:hypothetical protein
VVRTCCYVCVAERRDQLRVGGPSVVRRGRYVSVAKGVSNYAWAGQVWYAGVVTCALPKGVSNYARAGQVWYAGVATCALPKG